MSTPALVIAGIISLVSALAWIGFLLWAAIRDGAEQRRVYAVPEAAKPANHQIRLDGSDITDFNARLLIAELIADGGDEALDLAERMSIARRTRNGSLHLTSADRDLLLQRMPRPITRGLIELRDSLEADQDVSA